MARMSRPRPKVMTLTDAAASRVRDHGQVRETRCVALRVGVKNGGCAGMEYTMEWAAEQKPLDEVVEDKGVKILIDPKAVHVPARHRDGLPGLDAQIGLRLQQPEPDRRPAAAAKSVMLKPAEAVPAE